MSGRIMNQGFLSILVKADAAKHTGADDVAMTATRRPDEV